MLPNREGRFRAVIEDVGISESGKPPKLCVALGFSLTSELTAQGWRDVTAENMAITGYFYLELNDGSINTFTVDQFKSALRWSGRDIQHLITAKGIELQITLQNETYEGKTRLRVKYLNPFDYEGGGVKHDEDAMKRAQNRLGAKLRALSGGTSVPTVKVTPPPTVKTPEPSGFPWENRESTADECWSKLQSLYPTLPTEKQGAAWSALIASVLPGVTDISFVTPEQWGAVLNELERPDFKAVV